MASGASSLDSVDSSERDSGGYGSVGSPVGGSECRSDYDGSQCDQTLELQLLRHQHSDTVRRCDFAPCRCEHTINELEYYRGQHMVAMNQLEATSQETSALRGKYSDLINDKQRLEREVQSLQKEINEFRNQNQEVLVTDTNDAETMTHLYKSAIKKYEVVKEEYDSLRKRYDDLIAGHSSAVNKLELAEEEVTRLKKQYDDIVQERNSAFRERNGLKQQCTAALREWDIALRERNEYREALSKVQQQHEEAVKEINQAMMLRMKASKDMKRLTEERNAALQEYSLIMGERDTVHKEMEKLGDDLQQAYSRITHLENQNKQINDEKKTLSYQTETLRREISSALNDRDEALKECNKLRLKFGDYTECTSRDYKNHIELHSYNHECGDVTNKEAERETNTRDYEKRKKERMDDLDQANLELDKLRKIVDTLQFQLDEAIPDAEVSKRRRDWAFSERDKVVLERESIRSLCDTLRQERDRAVSELAGALRDSDDIKKQKNEALKELKNLREMIKCNNDFNSLRQYQYGYNENDVTEWDLLTIHIDLTRLYQESNDFGFLLVGGRDDPHYPNDTGIYVAQINPGSSLDGKLRINDCILRVNNIDCTSVTTRMILETLRSSNVGTASLTIRRRRCTSKFLRTTQLSIGNISHGITLELGIYISKLSPGSLSAKNGNLAVGDRVLNINGKPMDNVGSLHEAVSILNDNTIDVLTITTLKGIPPLPLLSNNDTTTTTTMTTTTTTTSSSLSSSPIQFNSDNNKQKMVNNYSQTEQERMMLKATSDDYERRYIASNIGDRSIYKVSKSVSSEKSSGISHAWDNIREKIDIVRGRRNSKDREDKKKRNHRNTSPNTFEQEQDAIAELDSVIDSYHKKTNNNNNNNGVLKRSKRRGTATTLSSLSSTTSSSLAAGGATTTTATSGISGGLTTLSITNDNNKIEKNGGTWPKTRGGGPIIQNGTGTIIYPRRTKERPLLSVLPNNPPKYDSFGYNKISNPVPLSSFTNVSNRHTVYKAMETPLQNFSKLFGQKSFIPQIQFKDIAMEKKSVNDFDTSATSATSTTDGRSVGSHTPSETSIDYSIIKSGNIGEYGHTKRRVQKQQQQQYSSGSNELTAQDSLQHNRTHSQLYPSVASSSLSSTTTTTAINQPRQQLAGNFSFPPFTHTHPHPHQHQQITLSSSRYPSPSSLPSAQSGESIGLPDTRSYCFEPTYNPLTQLCGHNHTPSMDLYYNKSRIPHHPVGVAYDVPTSYIHGYEGGTFPRKKENQRFRIPSNPSVTSKNSVGKLSTGSIERTSDRGSPMPTFHVEVLSPGTGSGNGGNNSGGGNVRCGNNKRLSMPDYCYNQPTPAPGELRRVHIDKSVEPLGIQISCLKSGGVFVSTVSEHSLASQVGLQIGDQLLEVCGINMRSATYQLAANVLRQCGNSITMLVQYSPDKYNETEGSGSSSSSEAGGEEAASRSGSPTPCNSPEVPRKSTIENDESTEPERDTTNTLMPPVIREREVRSSASMEVRGTQEREREIRNSASLDINIRKPELRNSATLESMRNSMTIDSLRSGTLTRGQINQAITTLQRQNATVRSPTQEEQQQNRTKIPPTIEPRYLFIETRKCSNLGISLVGGNGVGIFVHSVQSGCLAEDAGLCTGDRILEYNGVDLRQATAEQAALELARPADKVTLVAQYMPDRYNEVKDKPGDSFYVKAMFDRIGEIGDSLQLRFNKDDILYVDNTMFNGTPGHWRAWVVDQSGRRHQCGIIPSKFKIEEELLLRRSLGDLETDNSRRGTTSARRSFFRRKKHHRSSSRDSKDLSQLTSVNMGWYSDSGTLNEDNLPASYQRVERLDYPTLRPILIVGPLNECVATKLLQEFPGEYIKCLPEAMHCSQATLDQGLRDSLYVDYRKKGSYFECTTVQAVKDICAKNSHCILDISIASIERLHRHQIYPIVLLIKFKSTKQIKEVKDSRYPSDKISAKAAKEMYEHALKLETEYRQFISAVIPAEANMIYLCNSIKTEVDQEQSKALWVPRGPT
ncbi:disks large homolog 5-like isoform X2 [Aphidius gifuensis]|uniref:disks large homolog 5-like isoform X2 n=1 Tax=Aphidius gifuensis TaxID=684658 RepID=UPI001CDC536F|nr:disks large homolog 5-like isoform X2 [Aphidius gifuensis]